MAKASKQRAGTVLAAARRLPEPLARAQLLESNLDAVDQPAMLVEPMLDAYFASSLTADQIGEHVVALCRRKRDRELLEEAGQQLALWRRGEEAIVVLTMAIDRGATTSSTRVKLARLLVARGDPKAVPLLELVIRSESWSSPQAGAARVALATWYLQRDEPGHALAMGFDAESERELELRSMAHEALGQTTEAQLMLAIALRLTQEPLLVRQRLCAWHWSEDRHERALVHARVLFAERPTLAPARLAKLGADELDKTIVQAYRLGGGFTELIPWLLEAWPDTIPAGVAWHVHHGLVDRSPIAEPELAIRAARSLVEHHRKRGEWRDVRTWTIREARVRGRDGDLAALVELATAGLDDDAAAWVVLAAAYKACRAYAAAAAAADRALDLDPHDGNALVVLYELALAAGDGDTMHRIASALATAKPFWHQGPEHLAQSHVRRGEVAEALRCSERAVHMGAHCNNAWAIRAEALLLAGELVPARAALAKAIAIRTPDASDDVAIVVAALAGDRPWLERALAERHRHLPALPFLDWVTRLRAVAGE